MPYPQLQPCKAEDGNISVCPWNVWLFFNRYLGPYISKPRSGELRTEKLKSHLVRTQSLQVLPLKPGLGQYNAMHATLTARDFFLANFYLSGPFTCVFSSTSSKFFLCQLRLTLVPVYARRIYQVTLLDAVSRVECPRNINRLKKTNKQKTYHLWYDDL